MRKLQLPVGCCQLAEVLLHIVSGLGSCSSAQNPALMSIIRHPAATAYCSHYGGLDLERCIVPWIRHW